MCSIQLQITIIISNYHHFSVGKSFFFFLKKRHIFFICKGKSPLIMEIAPFSRLIHFKKLTFSSGQTLTMFHFWRYKPLPLSLTPLSHGTGVHLPKRQPAGVSDARSGSASLQRPVSHRRRAHPRFTGRLWSRWAPPLSSPPPSPSAPASRHPRRSSHL